MYNIVIVKSALKELSKLPTKEAIKITSKINTLKHNPRPKGCVKLTGSKNEYRFRIGNYRVLYNIEDKVLIVKVFKIKDRKDAY